MFRRSILFFIIAIIAAVAGFDALKSNDSGDKHERTKEQVKAEIDR